MDDTKHTPEWRLRVLLEARQLGNDAEVCKKHGMDRTTFYKLKKRCGSLPQREWLAALQDLPRTWKTHGQQTSDAHRAAIINMARQHPSWGCNRIETALVKKRILRSHNTIQKILNDAEIGTRAERWLDLDKPGVKLSEEQATFVEEVNPNYRDRAVRKTTPGALLFADAFKVGPFDGLGETFLYVVIDSCTSHVWSVMQAKLNSGNSVWLLENRFIPEFKKSGYSLGTISTLSGPGFGRAYIDFVAKQKFSNNTGKIAGRGYIERFKATVVKDFVLGTAVDQEFATIGELQKAFNEWWRAYNRKAHDGFPCYGKSPESMLRKSGG